MMRHVAPATHPVMSESLASHLGEHRQHALAEVRLTDGTGREGLKLRHPQLLGRVRRSTRFDEGPGTGLVRSIR